MITRNRITMNSEVPYMQKITIRLISLCLSLVMMLSSMPLQSFAESQELPDELATILPLDEILEEGSNPEPLSLPDGQTIILPLVEKSERKIFLEDEFENNTNTVYAPTDVNS